MLCCNTVHEVCDYASAAVYRECPNIEQIRAGVVPLDSLPAAWWNWMWWDTNTAVNEARDAVGAFVNEFNTVLQAAGVCADCTCVDQLYQAIEKIRKTIGTATCPGAVKSSSTGGQVSIDNDGLMTVNCFGNASSLTTQARTLVGAINELKSTYDCDFTDVGGAIDTLTNCKAPNMHASSTTIYGVGNASCYGHVKLSDTFDQVLASCEGVAASQYALATVFSCIAACGGAPAGNTAACPVGGLSTAGSCSTVARSDHRHSICAGTLYDGYTLPTCAFFRAGTTPSCVICHRVGGDYYICPTICVATQLPTSDASYSTITQNYFGPFEHSTVCRDLFDKCTNPHIVMRYCSGLIACTEGKDASSTQCIGAVLCNPTPLPVCVQIQAFVASSTTNWVNCCSMLVPAFCSLPSPICSFIPSYGCGACTRLGITVQQGIPVCFCADGISPIIPGDEDTGCWKLIPRTAQGWCDCSSGVVDVSQSGYTGFTIKSIPNPGA